MRNLLPEQPKAVVPKRPCVDMNGGAVDGGVEFDDGVTHTMLENCPRFEVLGADAGVLVQ